MRKVETYGSVKNGVLKISYRDKFIKAVKNLDDSRVKVTVEKLYRKRSTQTIRDDGTEGRGENGYYWTVVVKEYQNGCLETQGRYISAKQSHEELLCNCSFVEKYNEDTGTVMRLLLRTSEMNTVQFEEYMDKCRAFILEWFGITVPFPNEQCELELK